MNIPVPALNPRKKRPSPGTPKPAKAQRSDGIEARTKLLNAALKLFAEKGFAKTSTREIALAAEANIAAISYYFGDKAGLYRAVFEDPRFNPPHTPLDPNAPLPDLHTLLDQLLRTFVDPLKNEEQQVRQCMKLHFREMIEPTGMWQAEIDNNIKPDQEALALALCRHMGLPQPDDDVYRLSFAISGLGVMLHVGMDIIQAIRPALIATPAGLDTYHERLLASALALVQAEVARRMASPPLVG